METIFCILFTNTETMFRLKLQLLIKCYRLKHLVYSKSITNFIIVTNIWWSGHNYNRKKKKKKKTQQPSTNRSHD